MDGTEAWLCSNPVQRTLTILFGGQYMYVWVNLLIQIFYMLLIQTVAF
jgi:hypothetical protein